MTLNRRVLPIATNRVRRWRVQPRVAVVPGAFGIVAIATLMVIETPFSGHGARANAAREDAIAQSGHRRIFSNATLNDRYGFHVLALTMDPANPRTGGSLPFAIAGYYDFMGDGTLSGRDLVSQGGSLQLVPRQYQGVYHVNADGTGSLTLFISPTFRPEGQFVITKSGDEVEIIFAVPGNLNAFTLNKQHVR